MSLLADETVSPSLSPYLFSDDLHLVCTSNCIVGLESYRAGVVSACGNYMITDSSNNTYAPTLALDYVSGPYTVQCLQDPLSGDLCSPIVESYNTTNGLLSLPTNELCTFCTLKTLNATLSNPTSYSIALADLLSSAIATCGTYVPLTASASPISDELFPLETLTTTKSQPLLVTKWSCLLLSG